MQYFPQQVIRTNEAQCRDCYCCLRHCPVKAIRMTGNQAAIEPKLCLSCGQCIGVCPQKAKAYRHDLHYLQQWLQEGKNVAVSLAPSFAATFTPAEYRRLVGALRQGGFQYVAETTVALELLAEENKRLLSLAQIQPVITSACAAVVNLIEIYYPQLLSYLAPLLSPMLAHGAYLKQTLGESWKTVFIGPCLAKKSEADSARNKNAVDLVLGFEELQDWLAARDIALTNCRESEFDDEADHTARTYPLKGGHLHVLGISSSPASPRHFTACGFAEVEEVLKTLTEYPRPCLVEAFLCPEGCIGGPLMATALPLYERRYRVAEFAHEKRPPEKTPKNRPAILPMFNTGFVDRSSAHFVKVSERDILEVLKATGKADPQDQLNCGSCGFASCREKAIAVVKGMAVPEVCLPHMRRLAERRTDRIIETSPNGIVITDQDLNIISMNKAFQKLFSCGNEMEGHKLSTLIDTNLFEELISTERQQVEKTVHHTHHGVICHEIAYFLPEANQFVGIFVNVTETLGNQEHLASLRSKSLLQTRELLDNQLRLARQITRMLGEHTAQTEKLVRDMMMLATDNLIAQDEWQVTSAPPKEPQPSGK